MKTTPPRVQPRTPPTARHRGIPQRLRIHASVVLLLGVLAVSPRIESVVENMRTGIQRDVLAGECLAVATALQQAARDGATASRTPVTPNWTGSMWFAQENGDLVSPHGRFSITRTGSSRTAVVHAASFIKPGASITLTVHPDRTENFRYRRWD